MDVADRFGDPYRQATAHEWLGEAYLCQNNVDKAAECWRFALRRYEQGGSPTNAVRAKLDKLSVTSS